MAGCGFGGHVGGALRVRKAAGCESGSLCCIVSCTAIPLLASHHGHLLLVAGKLSEGKANAGDLTTSRDVSMRSAESRAQEKPCNLATPPARP